jgi:hypothetical protein
VGVATFFLAAALSAPVAVLLPARDPGLPGPFAATVASSLANEIDDVHGNDTGVHFDLWTPDAAAAPDDPPRVLVGLAHDAGGAPASVAGLARHLASWGFVVVVPALHEEDPDRDERALASALAFVLRAGGRRYSALAMAGHGTGAYIARAGEPDRHTGIFEVPPRLATVLLDPDDDTQLLDYKGHRTSWGAEGDDMNAPRALVLVAEPNPCDDRAATARAIFEGPLVGQRRLLATIPHASHCDAVEPSDDPCRARCGKMNSDGSAALRFRRTTTAFLLAASAGQTWAEAWLPHARPSDFKSVHYRGPAPSRSERPLQLDVPLLLAGSLHAHDGDPARKSAFTAGIRPEFLLFRTGPASVGPGLYLEALTTNSFGDFATGGGISAVVPLGAHWNLSPSAGIFERRTGGDWRRGASGSLFLGTRHWNDFSHFDEAAGYRVEVREDLDGLHERSITFGVQFDLMTLASLCSMATNTRGW